MVNICKKTKLGYFRMTNFLNLVDQWCKTFFVFKQNFKSMMVQINDGYFPNHGNFDHFSKSYIHLAMTLNFDEIELGYKSLAEFYLTLSYYTDELPVDQLLNLPALSEIPKLPKVNLS